MKYVNRNKTHNHSLKYIDVEQDHGILVSIVHNKLVVLPLGVVGMAQRLCCSRYVGVSA